MRKPFQTASGRTTTAGRGDARLALGFQLLVALTLGLIALGSLVRANDAGLACPDWPLCHGELIPSIDLRVGFEWSHRVLAGAVALSFASLAGFAWRSSRRCRWITALLCVASLLLAIQIVLGALTVWLQLAPWTVAAHLITGNGFASTALLLALAFRPRADAALEHPAVSISNRLWITAAAGLLLFQLGTGGLVSSQYAGMACPEWPTCNGGVWWPSWGGGVGIHLLHRLTAYALIGCLGAAALSARRDRRLRRTTALALGVAILQACVGVANVLSGIPAALTGLHTAVAAGLTLTLVYGLRAAWSARGERECCSDTR